jgi:hypothetical protein
MGDMEKDAIEDFTTIMKAAGAAALARYERLAEQMRSHGNAEIAGLFNDIVARTRAQWPTPGDPAQAPEGLFENIEGHAGGPYLMTGQRALNLVVNDQRRLLELATRLTAELTEPAARAAAAALVGRARGHLAPLRLLRRRAGRAGPGQGEEDDSLMVSSLAAFEAAAAEREARSAGLQAALAALARKAGDETSADLLSSLPPPDTPAVENAVTLPGEPRSHTVLVAALRDMEALFEAYMMAAQAAGDDVIVTAAQQRAEDALARLSAIHQRLAEIDAGN